jgi:cell division protein FtsZ
MSIKLELPKLTDLKPRITVIGVGGAGCNAINNMIAAGLNGVDFVVANTDAQALAASSAEHRLQLGVNLTEGLGAGSRPEIGEAAAEEAVDDIRAQITGSHMVFIAAGMGGGTGTGAAAVIARTAKEIGILAVGIVTKPFHFEGARRMRTAEAGIAEIRKQVDTLIVIPNQNLFRVANEKTTFAEAFVLADQVLYSGVACIVDLIIKEGLINLDFADVRTIMSGMGSAVMGTGEASGERRATLAAEEAIANPLLDEVSLKGAKGLLLSITGGNDLTLYEVDEAASRVRQEVDAEANIIVGATFDETLGDRVRVSIVASGMALPDESIAPAASPSELRMRASKAAAAAAVVGEMPRAAQPSSMPDNDMRRRLSEAIEFEQQGGTRPLPESRREPSAEPPRDSWRAPGDVVIEEGFSHLNWLAQSARTRAREGNVPSEPAQEFKPAPPADIRRGARRMPDVEDFPPIMQREYRAKVGYSPDTAPRAPAAAGLVTDSLTRLGLLQRIMGRARGVEEPASENVANHQFDSAEDESLAASEDEIWWDDDAEAETDPSTARPESSVPAIFNRLRK